jgi:HEAT repeat protein
MEEPTLLNDEQMREFITDGYLLFQPTIPATVHEAIYQRLNEIIDVEPNPGNNVLPRVPEMRHVLNCPEVRGALISVLGPDYIEHPHRFCHPLRPVMEPVSDDEAAAKLIKNSHQDGYTPLGHPRQHYIRYARVMYYPQDTTVELGPTHLIPGSQFNKGLTDEDKTRLIPWEAKAGSVMVSHFDIGHAAGVSSVPQFRHMIKFIYLRASEPSEPTWDSQSTEWKRPKQVQVAHDLELAWSHGWDWLCGKLNRYDSWQKMHSGAQDPVSKLIEGLSAENDLNKRLESAQLLASSGSGAADAIDPLIEILDSDHQTLRVAAIYTLGAIGNAAIEPLVTHLRAEGEREDANEKPTPWSEGAIAMGDAANALGAIGSEAVEALRGLLREGEGWACINAAFALAEMDSAAAASVPDLVACLDSKSHRLVRTALDSLGSIRQCVPAKKLSALFKMTRPEWDEEIHRWWSPQDGVRTHAAMALARLGSDSSPAQDDLIAALDDPCGHAASFAMVALQRIGSPEAIQAAMEFLLSQRWDASVDGVRQF